MNMTLEEIGAKAKKASYSLSCMGSAKKNEALLAMANAIRENYAYIIEKNAEDIEAARGKIKDSLIDRLSLDEKRVNSMADGIEDVISLPDPRGVGLGSSVRPNGLKIEKVRVPLGVIAIIYEARPNVTADAAALTLKSGNAVILRGGKEAIRSNEAIVKVMRGALEKCGIDPNAVQLIEDTSRETANALMKLNKYVDVLIPRGGAGLIKSVVENSTVPVIETGTGNCHVYVDSLCDLDMAANIVFNAKTSRPSVCNAEESLLVHKDIAEIFLPYVKERLDAKNVEIRGCERTAKIIPCTPATEEDFYTEFLDYIISVKVVDSLEEAIEHINLHGTKHSECIVTSSYENSREFLSKVDAAAVYVNASTRFTDGGEFGLGAEIGISTQKLHARGPMGLNELTTVKFCVYGDGQTR
ncbi:MAG: glutamate-5-semialdehyde dehydrogenase [Clostridia bacterium]|nr:glutamate-5-semialdehyde dehydrogenase [Clostridia bacterium]